MPDEYAPLVITALEHYYAYTRVPFIARINGTSKHWSFSSGRGRRKRSERP